MFQNCQLALRSKLRAIDPAEIKIYRHLLRLLSSKSRLSASVSELREGFGDLPRIRQCPPKDGSAPNCLAETDQPQLLRLRRGGRVLRLSCSGCAAMTNSARGDSSTGSELKPSRKPAVRLLERSNHAYSALLRFGIFAA